MNHLALTLSALALAGAAATSHAQTAVVTGAAASAPTQPWRYSTPRLTAGQIDRLLAQPDKVLVLDVRRPDELIQYGSFPVFLNIQNSELEKHLAYLPKDRLILTVSNHAQRAGAAGDLLSARGFKVAGAAGSEDYEREGGKSVAHIRPPAPRASASAVPVQAAAR